MMKARTKKRYLSGWCDSAARIEQGDNTSSFTADYFRSKCAGAWQTPSGTLRCTAPHHTGLETPVRREDFVVARAKVVAAKPAGKRDAKFLDSIADTLRKSGTLTFDAPDDEKQNKALRERIYSAARRSGMKVKVTNKNGVITATVKQGSEA